MPRVSIIIPCYNVERYLPQCLDSILNQTLKDLEIILINDGSTDSSGTIIDCYAHSDPRIIVVHQKNRGLSAARNRGLELASAPYILFIDSDDWIDPEMAEELYHKAEGTSADLVVCNYHEEQADGKTSDLLKLCEEVLYFKEINIYKYYFHLLSEAGHAGYVWNKLYKKAIILQNGLFFSSSMTSSGEDALFNLCYFLHVRKVAVINSSLYHYRIRHNSNIHSIQPEIITNYVNLVEIFMDYSRHQGQDQLLKGLFPHLLYHFLSMGLQHNIENPVPTKNIRQQLHKVTGNKLFFPLMKQLYCMQLLNIKLPGGPERESVSRRLRTSLFAFLALGRMHRVLIFFSRFWLRCRRFQKSERPPPKKELPFFERI